MKHYAVEGAVGQTPNQMQENRMEGEHLKILNLLQLCCKYYTVGRQKPDSSGFQTAQNGNPICLKSGLPIAGFSASLECFIYNFFSIISNSLG